jgi:hypothetical protein
VSISGFEVGSVYEASDIRSGDFILVTSVEPHDHASDLVAFVWLSSVTTRKSKYIGPERWFYSDRKRFQRFMRVS